MIDHPADDRLAGLALAIGRRNLGLTWPNPSVGAVLVDRRNVILATGITQPGGRPHAEPVALAAAGEAARGGTLYVSLEPCSHHGHTPPCTDAIVAAGIARVVAPISDPDTRVAGRGFSRLRQAGIVVGLGVRAAEGWQAHRGHITRVREGRPHLTLKLARTADGFAAAAGGGRLTITGDGANRRTHLARAGADAVMVGIATVLADDPRLDVRLPGLEGRKPVRVILDTSLRLPPDAEVCQTASERPTWAMCGPDASREREERLRACGETVLRSEADGRGRLDLPAALRLLAARGLTSIWCEGGPTLGDALAAAALVDEVVLLTGPAPLGRPGLPAIGPHLAATLRRDFVERETVAVGPDTTTLFEKAEPCSPAS